MPSTELTARWAERDAQRTADIAVIKHSAKLKSAVYRALPVIIVAPGDYATRDGRQVTIHTLGRVTATGGIWKEFRGKMRARGHLTWDFNGRRNFLNEQASDIVGPWSAAAPS